MVVQHWDKITSVCQSHILPAHQLISSVRIVVSKKKHPADGKMIPVMANTANYLWNIFLYYIFIYCIIDVMLLWYISHSHPMWSEKWAEFRTTTKTLESTQWMQFQIKNIVEMLKGMSIHTFDNNAPYIRTHALIAHLTRLINITEQLSHPLPIK